MEERIQEKQSIQVKIICGLLAIAIFLCPFVQAVQIVSAEESDQSKQSDREFEENLITEYANDLEFIYNNAVKLDSEGNICEVNLSVLRAEYGNNEFFDHLENRFGPYGIQPRADFGNCMKNEFGKIIGLDIAKQVFSPQVKKLLAGKAWKKASTVIVQSLGKKLGTKALKKLVGKMIPGGIPAQIIFSAGKCGIKAVL